MSRITNVYVWICRIINVWKLKNIFDLPIWIWNPKLNNYLMKWKRTSNVVIN